MRGQDVFGDGLIEYQNRTYIKNNFFAFLRKLSDPDLSFLQQIKPMKKLFFVLVGLVAAFQVNAQNPPPSTDIYIVDLSTDPVSISSESLMNATDRDGYDNQPFFSPDGQYVLFTSFRENQTDIHQVDLSDGEVEQVTRTSESEYSPTVTPDGGISVIRVEADGTQRLWRFDRSGDNPSLLFTDIKPVGYHAWVDAEHIAMFILGQPPTLQVGTLASGEAEVAAESIGRSLHRIPDSKHISFVHKKSESDWRIRWLDPSAGTTKDIAPTLPGREDYAWTPDATLLMADGATLYRWDQKKDDWVAVFDFAPHGITNISRLAVSPKGDKLAFVAGR